MTRPELLAKIAGVDGFLSDHEAWALYLAARSLAAEAPRIVEIGSYKGRSTIALGMALVERQAGTLIAIDPHAPTGKRSYMLEHGDADTYAEYEANLARSDVAAFVTSMRTTSTEARKTYDTRPIDMLFVDGSHDYEDVLADIDAWTPLLSENAVVAFNDPYARGVNRALRERINLGTRRLTSFRHINNTLFARSVASAPASRGTPFAVALYLYVERMRFKLVKLALKGVMEMLGIVYTRPTK
ncbi:MAG: class I SAM-dependent methyltransferase [Vulcanimicrobiaceae bacterium]|jgi:predicted O-methyltransferase YrrM